MGVDSAFLERSEIREKLPFVQISYLFKLLVVFNLRSRSRLEIDYVIKELHSLGVLVGPRSR